MRVLRFLWQRVLAFDRIGSRIPQLIQIWLVELFFVMPLAFFIGKVIDIRGAFGVPGTGESLDRVFWGRAGGGSGRAVLLRPVARETPRGARQLDTHFACAGR